MITRNRIFVTISVAIVFLLIFFFVFAFNKESVNYDSWQFYSEVNDLTKEEELFIFMTSKSKIDSAPPIYLFTRATCGKSGKESSFLSSAIQSKIYQDINFEFSAYTNLEGTAESGKSFKRIYHPSLRFFLTDVEIIDSESRGKKSQMVFVPTKDYMNSATPFSIRKFDHTDFVYVVNPWFNRAMETTFLKNIRMKLYFDQGESIVIEIPIYSELFSQFFAHCENLNGN